MAPIELAHEREAEGGPRDGIYRCGDCAWTGVPTIIRGEAQTWCPACEAPEGYKDDRERPARNAPCDCGSGKKSKKCCWR